MAEPDMSPSAIGERLRKVSELRTERPEPDMSPKAVAARLRRVSQLRDLCRKLGRLTAGGGE